MKLCREFQSKPFADFGKNPPEDFGGNYLPNCGKNAPTDFDGNPVDYY